MRSVGLVHNLLLYISISYMQFGIDVMHICQEAIAFEALAEQ